MFVLESAEHARRRGARVHAWVQGWGTSSEAYHPSTPNPSGEWERLAMHLAATEAGERAFYDNRRRHNENMARLLSGWSGQEVRQLAAFLARLNTDVEAHERARETGGDIPHNGLEGREG